MPTIDGMPYDGQGQLATTLAAQYLRPITIVAIGWRGRVAKHEPDCGEVPETFDDAARKLAADVRQPGRLRESASSRDTSPTSAA